MPQEAIKPLSEREYVTPLEVKYIQEYWSYNANRGQFNSDLYERVLIEKQKQDEKVI